MRSSTLVVAMAVAFLAIAFALDLSFAMKREDDSALPLPKQGYDVEGEIVAARKPWTCCNVCMCVTSSLPVRCRCLDEVPNGCHKNCKKCVQTPEAVHPPIFQCHDVVLRDCGSKCTPPPGKEAKP